VIPVLGLLNATLVGLSEQAVVVQGSDGSRELRHGVKGLREGVQHINDMLGKTGTRVQLLREKLNLLVTRNLTGQKQPEETLGEWLGTTSGLGKNLLELRDGMATEADTLLSVEKRGLPNHRLDGTHTGVGLQQNRSRHQHNKKQTSSNKSWSSFGSE
jgi:hypothetical protein